MKTQVVRWGNSLALRIPKPILEEARVKEGDYLEIEASEGQLALRRASKKRYPTLAQLVEQISSDNRYSELPSGREVGKETIEW